MSIDFTGVTAIIIPEGNVSQIMRKSDGTVLWEKMPSVESPYSVCPSSFINESLTSVSNESNGFAFVDNTTYAILTSNSLNDRIGYFNFDLSAIPSNATITNITCEVKIQTSMDGAVMVDLYLIANNISYIIKRSASPSSATIHSATFADIGNDILIDPKLKINVRSMMKKGSMYFYGATLTVEFTT